MRIPLLDLTRYNTAISEQWLAAVKEITLSGHLLNGPYKKEFESEFASYLGVKHVLGVSSGTDAIRLCLEAVGVGEGDEVVTHSNAFIAVIEAIISTGATPVLVDMANDDYGPDINALKSVVSPRTKAVIAVHLLGLPVELPDLLSFCNEKNISVIEDCSQAHGALYDEKKAGSFGAINAFSLGPVKNLASLGDAGCISTNNTELFEKARIFSVHGQVTKNQHVKYGWNARLDELQAAWLLLGLETLDQRNSRRRDIYSFYMESFSNLPVGLMPLSDRKRCVFHQAVLTTEKREGLKVFLGEKGIGTGVYYPSPLHKQAAWTRSGFPELSHPRSEKFSAENIAIPVFPELSDSEVEYIASSVKEYFK